MMNKWIIGILFLSISNFVVAQESYLTFKRKPVNYKTSERFFVGDNIQFKLKGERVLRTENVRIIGDSSFFTGMVYVPYQKVSHIRIFREGGYIPTKFFLYGGIAYPILSVSNGFLMNERPLLTNGSFYVMGTSLVGYLLFKYVFYGWKSYPINENRKLLPIIF
jgi:hypothetical protein